MCGAAVARRGLGSAAESGGCRKQLSCPGDASLLPVAA